MCPNENSDCVTTRPHAVTTYPQRRRIVKFYDIDDNYLNDILYYTGDSISSLDKMTSFIKLIITCTNTYMLKMLQLSPLSPTGCTNSLHLYNVGPTSKTLGRRYSIKE